jgi:hypothetical protein
MERPIPGRVALAKPCLRPFFSFAIARRLEFNTALANLTHMTVLAEHIFQESDNEARHKSSPCSVGRSSPPSLCGESFEGSSAAPFDATLERGNRRVARRIDRLPVNLPAGFFQDNDVEIPVASSLLVSDGRCQMLAVSDRRCRARELRSGAIPDGHAILGIKIISPHDSHL